MSDKDTTIRFSKNQRVQHIVLMISFSTLCLTGLPQRYADTGWARVILSLLGGIDSARIIHHFASVLFAAGVIYHLMIALLDLILIRPRSLSMLPKIQDFKDAFQSVTFMLGRTKDKPAYDRFDFKQKVEYWAMIWGAIVMGITGFILLFPTIITRFLPGVVLPAAKIVHSYEALLAFLAILTWHMYNAHLASEVFPLDTSIFTGRISKHRMQEDHPLELQRIENASTPKTPEPAGSPDNSQASS